MTTEIKCLDHGFVRLVDSMGNDLSVARSARVSHNAAWRAGEDEGSDKRLLRYLWRNKHTTPFESVTFTFEVKAPIFIFRQWHRHRTWSYNELSARYKELPEEFYIPDSEKIGIQDPKNKQARVFDDLDEVQLDAIYQARGSYIQSCQDSFAVYKRLLQDGWPRELARSVLPFATYSHMFGTVNLLNLLKFLILRDDSHAQYEIQVYAKALKELATTVCPTTLEIFGSES